MGAYLSAPDSSKVTTSGACTALNLRWSTCSMQGWRVSMEDSHLVLYAKTFSHSTSASPSSSSAPLLPTSSPSAAGATLQVPPAGAVASAAPGGDKSLGLPPADDPAGSADAASPQATPSTVRSPGVACSTAECSGAGASVGVPPMAMGSGVLAAGPDEEVYFQWGELTLVKRPPRTQRRSGTGSGSPAGPGALAPGMSPGPCGAPRCGGEANLSLLEGEFDKEADEEKGRKASGDEEEKGNKSGGSFRPTAAARRAFRRRRCSSSGAPDEEKGGAGAGLLALEEEEEEITPEDVETGDVKLALFAVFDGHGGAHVARYAAEHLPQALLAQEGFRQSQYGAALRGAYLEVDEELRLESSQDELSFLTHHPPGHMQRLEQNAVVLGAPQSGPASGTACSRRSVRHSGAGTGTGRVFAACTSPFLHTGGDAKALSGAPAVPSLEGKQAAPAGGATARPLGEPSPVGRIDEEAPAGALAGISEEGEETAGEKDVEKAGGAEAATRGRAAPGGSVPGSSSDAECVDDAPVNVSLASRHSLKRGYGVASALPSSLAEGSPEAKVAGPKSGSVAIPRDASREIPPQPPHGTGRGPSAPASESSADECFVPKPRSRPPSPSDHAVSSGYAQSPGRHPAGATASRLAGCVSPRTGAADKGAGGAIGLSGLAPAYVSKEAARGDAAASDGEEGRGGGAAFAEADSRGLPQLPLFPPACLVAAREGTPAERAASTAGGGWGQQAEGAAGGNAHGHHVPSLLVGRGKSLRASLSGFVDGVRNSLNLGRLFSRAVGGGSQPNALKSLASLAGCTAITVLVTPSWIIVGNVGDSRCVMCRGDEAVELSRDHKPQLPEERIRIYAAGGYLEMGRVNGNLNLSRALGDLVYKQDSTLPAEKQIVSAVPDIVSLHRDPEKDEFIIIGCDGIWELLSSQEVVDFIRKRIEDTADLSQILQELLDSLLSPNPAVFEYGCDNMTAILVDLKPETRQHRLAAFYSTSSQAFSSSGSTSLGHLGSLLVPGGEEAGAVAPKETEETEPDAAAESPSPREQPATEASSSPEKREKADSAAGPKDGSRVHKGSEGRGKGDDKTRRGVVAKGTEAKGAEAAADSKREAEGSDALPQKTGEES
ncbi:hypothetical protein BESB_050180 [Besnoitia besnoiti]|uniref:protein-serine/threonine phosphatase n=1 Tax=Besnoitia besnoiti TaxID=94643 RepID=A0A2A9MLD2_BESBE|nr:hypothetical protein BESB_050180 [Besnoitia besnoiti]PFH36826.1 hypothetical protein BESB_050180 [Besnoitia besnoiti]